MYSKGCELGDADGCLFLGLMHYRGEGAARDENKARALFGKACDGGLVQGCVSAGWVEFGTPNDAAARGFFEKVCADATDPDGGLACFNLGTMLRYVDKKPGKAGDAFEKACKVGYVAGCVQQAALLYKKRPVRAANLADERLELVLKGCKEANDGETCLALAEWYRVSGEKKKGKKFKKLGNGQLKKECESGDKGSCRVLKLRAKANK